MNNTKEDFSEIYDKYIDKIYRFIFIKVNSEDTAQDLASETFLRFWELFSNDKKIDNIQAFLYKIAKNLVIDYYRGKGKVKIVPIESTSIIDDSKGLEEKVQDNLNILEVKAALTGLKEDYQDIIIWHYLDDLSISEIAVISEKSEGAVRVMLHRALKDLKEVLEA